jgi:hypothetical protein
MLMLKIFFKFFFFILIHFKIKNICVIIVEDFARVQTWKQTLMQSKLQPINLNRFFKIQIDFLRFRLHPREEHFLFYTFIYGFTIK